MRIEHRINRIGISRLSPFVVLIVAVHFVVVTEALIDASSEKMLIQYRLRRNGETCISSGENTVAFARLGVPLYMSANAFA